MPKTIQQLRKIDAEELTAHDVVTLVVLAGLCASPLAASLPSSELVGVAVNTARAAADEFMQQRELRSEEAK